MNTHRALLAFIILVGSTFVKGSDSVEDILSSEASEKEKVEFIIAKMKTSFKEGVQLPKFATKTTLKSRFSIAHVEAGRPPFDMDFNDYLYYIKFRPENDEHQLVLFFSSELRATRERLTDLMSTDSDISAEFEIKKIKLMQ